MGLSVLTGVALAVLAPALAAQTMANCPNLPNNEGLRTLLLKAPTADGNAGGFFNGKREWAVVVNRLGQVCAIAVSTPEPTQAWPGSLPIAMAKAYAANGFSVDPLPLSTARLYTFSLPGHSLYGTGFAVPFATEYYVPPNQAPSGPPVNPPIITGGIVPYGGGVPLYKNGVVIGGLGASGDTPCADHEIAKRIRDMAGLNPPGGPGADDIVYPAVDGPSIYGHPLCVNTWRNGKFLGNEAAWDGLDASATAPGPRATARRQAEQAKQPPQR